MVKKGDEGFADDSIAQAATPAPSFTSEQLLKMLIDTQRELANSQKAMADAILESRKPYVDPKVLEQKRQANEERKKQIEIFQRNKLATKAACPHLRDDGKLNIKWMQHSNAIIKGVCGNCFSEFDTRNPTDLEFLRRDPRAQRNMGRAGQHAQRGAVI